MLSSIQHQNSQLCHQGQQSRDPCGPAAPPAGGEGACSLWPGREAGLGRSWSPGMGGSAEHWAAAAWAGSAGGVPRCQQGAHQGGGEQPSSPRSQIATDLSPTHGFFPKLQPEGRKHQLASSLGLKTGSTHLQMCLCTHEHTHAHTCTHTHFHAHTHTSRVPSAGSANCLLGVKFPSSKKKPA